MPTPIDVNEALHSLVALVGTTGVGGIVIAFLTYQAQRHNHIKDPEPVPGAAEKTPMNGATMSAALAPSMNALFGGNADLKSAIEAMNKMTSTYGRLVEIAEEGLEMWKEGIRERHAANAARAQHREQDERDRGGGGRAPR